MARAARGKASDRWLAETIEVIAAAGLDPRRWQDLPARLGRHAPGAKVILSAVAKRDDSGFSYHYGMDPSLIRQYDEHYCSINPWVPVLRGLPLLAAGPSDDTLPWWRFAECEFYNDFLKLEGEVEHGAAIKLADDPEGFAWIGFQYGHRMAERYNRELPRLLQQLAPALAGAIALNRKLQSVSAEATIVQVLEALGLPALLLNARTGIRHVNDLAATALERGELIRDDSRGRLRICDLSAAALFGQALARFSGGEEAAQEDIVLRGEVGEPVALLSLYPVASAAIEGGLGWTCAPERLVLLTLRELSPRKTVPSQMLRRLFGLTAAEARLAARLAMGDTLSEAAGALAVSRETARTHLQAIFAKTGTHRQAALVALFAQLSHI